MRSPKKEENAQIKKNCKKRFGSKHSDHLKVKDEIFAGLTSKTWSEIEKELRLRNNKLKIHDFAKNVLEGVIVRLS